MWDKRYDTTEYIYGPDPNEFLNEVVNQVPKGRTLCIAEGEGRNAVFLAGHGHEVVAVDSSAIGLEKARKLASERGVEIETLVEDLANFDIEADSWDAIVSIFAHVPADIRKPLHRIVSRDYVQVVCSCSRPIHLSKSSWERGAACCRVDHDTGCVACRAGWAGTQARGGTGA